MSSSGAAKVARAIAVLFLLVVALPLVAAAPANADSVDQSGTFTYTSDGSHITVTGCTALCDEQSVTVPSTIDSLPVTRVTSSGSAWSNVHIVELTIPSSVTSFDGAWQGNVNVTRVVFAPGSQVLTMPGFLFANNGRLESIVLPDHLRTIEEYAFYAAGLTSITFPGTVRTIGGASLRNNRFTAVTIPASVTSVSPGAFSDNVVITYGPPAISSVTYALGGGSMPNGASLPTQADTVQNTTFTVGGPTDPVKAGFDFGGWSDGVSTYGTGSTYTMGGDPVTLTAVWFVVTWTYTVQNGEVDVTGCAPSCFDAALTIPSSIDGMPVTSVARTTNFQTGGVHIAQLTIPNSVTTFGGGWQGNVNISRIVFAPGSPIRTISGFQFANNGRLESIVLPDHLQTIAEYAFYNAGLTSITIPRTVRTIGGDSFPYNRFTSVTIPASVTSLSPGAFSGNVVISYAPPTTSSVTYALGGGSMPGGASLPTQADTLQNTTFTVGGPTDPVKAGFDFGGWSDGISTYATGSTYTMGGDPVTLTAVWARITHQVDYDTSGASGPAPQSVTVGEGLTFLVGSANSLSLDGHSFAGWSDGTSVHQPGDTITMGTAPITLHAVWAIETAPVPDHVLLPGLDRTALGSPTNVVPSTTTDTRVTLGANGTSASITIPAGVLPAGTTLSIYPVIDTSAIARGLPTGQNFVVSLVVTWRAPDGTTPDSTAPISMTITNPAIHAGDHVYMFVNGVTTLVGTATVDGSVTISFSEDPVFAVSTPTTAGGAPVSDSPTAPPGATPISDPTNAAQGETAAPAAGATLPYTGTDTGRLVVVATLLLMVGAVLVLAARGWTHR